MHKLYFKSTAFEQEEPATLVLAAERFLHFKSFINLKQTGTVTPETYAALSKPPGNLLTNPRGAALAQAA